MPVNSQNAPFAPPVTPPSASASAELRRKITAATLADEARCIAPLAKEASASDTQAHAIEETARHLVTQLRKKDLAGGIDGLIKEYALSSQEGVALMCLAEALLRVPDAATRDALIRDKLAPGNWQAHLGANRHVFVNAATWGLLVTGRLVQPTDDKSLTSALSRAIGRLGEPMIRGAVDLAMRLLGEQFVLGENIGEALKRSKPAESQGFTYSYDMLGEAATSEEDARSYFNAYAEAIQAIGKSAQGDTIQERPGISIKLSALHPRFSRAQAGRVMAELLPRVEALAQLARNYNIGLNIDAEEADRLELSLDIFESLALDPALKNWDGLGFVAQAYSKRCPMVLDWLIDLAARSERRIMVRLVKGAYWDAEIKRSQVEGLDGFSVYTRKQHTDIAYLACARKLLGAKHKIFPQFATHNAQSLAAIYHMAGEDFALGDYEFQCLHGMGQPLYEEVVGLDRLDRPCRIYAPVGSHETLLAYLVRRLLENGANSSFVSRISDPAVPVEELTCDPVSVFNASSDKGAPHSGISHPSSLFEDRRNSIGLNVSDENTLAMLSEKIANCDTQDWLDAMPKMDGAKRIICNPGDHRDQLGAITQASNQDVETALEAASNSTWHETPVSERARILEDAADLMEGEMPQLLALLMREAGKTLPNGIAEVREAVDFLRFYAQQARHRVGNAAPLGPITCISPWNFPLAIFTGQVAAALVTGNCVLAKPAEETPLIAAQAVKFLHQAGVPEDALHFLPGVGSVGAQVIEAEQICGVIFTGSTQVARLIQAELASRTSPSGGTIPLIAETGGQNAMIVDSTALPEQVVADVLDSAFDSAGQRCSALRVLFLQEDIADRTLKMLRGAMAELRIDRADRIATDIGPVISQKAKGLIEAHVEKMSRSAIRITRAPLPELADHGTFVPPTIIELKSISQLGREVFGPVLHVLRYKAGELSGAIDAINSTGYGLTFGLHSRLDSMAEEALAKIRVGNRYVNRNVIGAVVGVQPFGGRGLSGTGPKAGGPLYLTRLAHDVRGPLRDDVFSIDLALTAFVQYLEGRGEQDLAMIAQNYGDVSPVGLERELAGPVGERNFYALHPRGTILLRAASLAGQCQQIAACLASGNRAEISGLALPDDMPETVLKRLSADGDEPIAAALFEGSPAGLIHFQTTLAKREGAIIPLQSATIEQCKKSAVYRIDWLCEELSTSINTAAAGGNASLMTLEE